MIRGITPIDTAFELMGLHQAQVLTHSIFWGTWAGKVIFALGFMLSLRAGLEQGNFRPAFIFAGMFFSLWILFVLPQARVVIPVSAMERAGYQEIKAADILRKAGYEQLTVNPVLDAFSRMADALMTAMTIAFDPGRQGRGYLRTPFLFIKLSLVTSGVILTGIRDPVLEDDLARFYHDHFWPAVKSMRITHRGLWPGARDVMASYQEQGRARWQALRDRLYAACDEDRSFSRMFEIFYDGKIDKDAVVRSLLEQEIRLKSARHVLFTYTLSLTDRSWGPAPENTKILWPGRIIAFLPFFQGWALFLLWSMLPLWLGAALLLRRADLLAGFLGIVLSVKAWTLAWVVLDKSSTAWLLVSKMWGGPWMWQAPAVNGMVALAALIVPVLLSAAVVLLFKNRRLL